MKKLYIIPLFMSLVALVLFNGCKKKSKDTVVAVQTISLDKNKLSLVLGTDATLTATVLPESATNKKVTWSSDNTAIATVDDAGKVTAIDVGTATITVTTVDGSYTTTCIVTVTASAIAVTNVSISKNALSLVQGNTEQLTATIIPADATNTNVTWKSDNTAIATVDNTGKVTAVAPGVAIITVTTEDGNFSDQCTVNVAATAAPNLIVNGDFSNIDWTTTSLVSMLGANWYAEPGDSKNEEGSWFVKQGQMIFWGTNTEIVRLTCWTKEEVSSGTYTLTINYESDYGVWLNVSGVDNDPDKDFATLSGFNGIGNLSTYTTDLTVSTQGTINIKITIAPEGWQKSINLYSISLVKKS